MDFIRTLATRLFYAIALLLAVLVLNFTLIHLAPGDVADTIAQSMGGADEEVLDDPQEEIDAITDRRLRRAYAVALELEKGEQLPTQATSRNIVKMSHGLFLQV